MKRIYLLLLSLSIKLMLLAQEGRLRPEDYEDFTDYYATPSESGIIILRYMVLFIVIAIVIGIIWVKNSVDNSRKNEVKNQTQFLAAWDTSASDSVSTAINKQFFYPKEYFTMEKGVVKIPKYAKCKILEYAPENKHFVKVQFTKYPQPLYMRRCDLKTPKEMSTR